MVVSKAPSLASSNRRIIPIYADGFLAICAGAVGGEPFGQEPFYWVAFAGALLLMSFCNHVLLTISTGASIGKLIGGLRVIRVADLGRPRLGPAVRRWLWGFYYILLGPVMFLTGTDMDHMDVAGLRIVRRADLRR
ncbi:RDD family protein [Nonomuraea purpurea]|uniref:RDD family protein n=1 Tax=Nonomuraea purpurea TaxID=1849276 RepID=A0ABV8G408_9ACTN